MTSHWDDRYKNLDTPWDREGLSPALLHWLKSGLETCRILVPGCGRGHEVLELARRGFDVTAVDVAPRAIDQVRVRLEEADLEAITVTADLLEWHPDDPFDVVYEQTCLCALEPRLWPAYADRLGDWLRPGGKLLASFMQTSREEGPPFHCDVETMRALFPPPDWRWPGASPVRIDHPVGFHELAFELERVSPASLS